MGESETIKTNNIFVSCSGDTSKRIADRFKQLIQNSFGIADIFLAEQDISKGARWQNELAAALEKSNSGLFFLTPENVNSPWMLFEAGAISKIVAKSRIWPVLFGINELDAMSPLSQFQVVAYRKEADRDLNKNAMHKLLHDITRFDNLVIFNNLFNQFWSDFKPFVDNVLSGLNHFPQPLHSDETLQIGSEFKVTVNKLGRRERIIAVHWLKNDTPSERLKLNWRTFGHGLRSLHNQIRNYTPALDPELFVGIRNVGGSMASIIGGWDSKFKKPVMAIRVDVRNDTPNVHEIIEQSIYVGEMGPQTSFRKRMNSSTIKNCQKLIDENRKRIRSIIVFDQEVKSGSSLQSVVEYLKEEFPNAKEHIYSAVLVASQVSSEFKTMNELSESGKFLTSDDCLPDFLAYTNQGGSAKLWINDGFVS